MRQNAQHVQGPGLDHQFEGPGEQEVADQHAGLVAEHLVGGGLAPAQRALVHHVVVQKGGGVDELDRRGEPDRLVAGMAAQAGRGQGQHGAQTLAARGHDIGGELRDKGDRALHPVDDRLVHRPHVVADEGSQPLERVAGSGAGVVECGLVRTDGLEGGTGTGSGHGGSLLGAKARDPL